MASQTVPAGSPLEGEVLGARGTVTVMLRRVEVSPAGSFGRSLGVARLRVDGDASVFELPTPRDAPPPSVGPQCRLGYLVAASDGGSKRRAREVAVPVEITGGEHAIHDSMHFDRIVPSQPGRHFHLELADLSLQGGGHLAGRVHVEPELGQGSFSVVARGEEAWRTNIRLRTRRQPPLWDSKCIWEQELTVEFTPDRRWSPFRFDIPGHLPPAVEGHAIAWRYEISAERLPRGLLSNRAVVTPLRFDVEF